VIALTLQAARNVHLAAQGLLVPPRSRATKKRLLDAIDRMLLLQIDTIHVVARSPYFVLFSRLGAYPQAWLEDALAEGKIFECWAHEACFAPIADYALLRHGVNPREHHWAHKRARRMEREHRADMASLLEHVRQRGAVKTSDFDAPPGERGGGGWWGWKAEKRWLEALFALGELMIARRENFHRVYDLTERVLERIGHAPAPPLSAGEIRREQTLRAVRALGVTQARWVADYFRNAKKHTDAELGALVAEGELVRVEVKGWEAPAYAHRDHAELLARAARGGSGTLRATATTLLSPFDPVVWDRARAKALFDFEYALECYTPEPKRKFGYFVLPILRRGKLVGRLDAKAHRAEGVFEVKALYLERDVTPDEELIVDCAGAIQRCAEWHETPRVVVRRASPKTLAPMLRSALARAADVTD
jgi:uncharacterized protein YcaQ